MLTAETLSLPSERLCASCGFPTPQPILRDGYALHAGPCLADYSRNGARYTIERLRDLSLVLAYDF